MTSLGFITGLTSCVVTVILGTALRITSKNDLGATILGMVYTILGAAWGFVFLGMLMCW